MKKKNIKNIFAPNGILSQVISNFNPRDEQIAMASMIEKAIVNKEKLVIEAGTGTGKTFAYLVPILLAKKKTIISTGSKNLQDQLFNRDLPTIKRALNYTGKITLLKGRSNYLCLERLHNLVMSNLLTDPQLSADLEKVRIWQQYTKTGDFAECPGLTENSPILSHLVSTNEDCIASEHHDCYITKARKRALSADIVVVNHHVFFADMLVKETGFSELLPDAEIVVFDEAHQVPDIASRYFSQSLFSQQLIDIAQDMVLGYRTEVKDMVQLDKAAELIKKSVQDLRLTMGTDNAKGDLRDLLADSKIQQALQFLLKNLDFGAEILTLTAGRSKLLDTTLEKLEACQQLLNNFKTTNLTGFCYWYEARHTQFSFHITPLSVADKFKAKMDKLSSTWIFTSATLEVNGKFDYFCSRLGIEDYKHTALISSFDYPNQALLCVPRNLPASNASDNTAETLASMLLPVIQANNGNCFLLCTSYVMMHKLANLLREKSELNVLEQGSMSKNELLNLFIAEPNSVLVATASFWEGVDVRGDTLSLVIIDKLPFASPDEPLLKARIEACKAEAKDPFNSIQLPEAVITLKQGVGRLIRDNSDRGVIIICDLRLVSRTYGEIFLRSLPPAKRTRDLAKVVEFLTMPEANV